MKIHFISKRCVVVSLLCVASIIATAFVCITTFKPSFKTSENLRVVITNPVSVASFALSLDDAIKSPQALRIPFRPNRPIRPIKPMRPKRPNRPLRPFVPPTRPNPPMRPVPPSRPVPPQRPWFPF